jgi:hypothetical protein
MYFCNLYNDQACYFKKKKNIIFYYVGVTEEPLLKPPLLCFRLSVYVFVRIKQWMNGIS